jgi:hypothetical protein
MYQLQYDTICKKYQGTSLILPFRSVIIFNDTEIYVRGGESTLKETYTHESIEHMSY